MAAMALQTLGWIPACWVWQLLVGDGLHIGLHVCTELGTARTRSRNLLVRALRAMCRWVGFIHTCHHYHVDAFGGTDPAYAWQNVLLDKFAKRSIHLTLAGWSWAAGTRRLLPTAVAPSCMIAMRQVVVLEVLRTLLAAAGAARGSVHMEGLQRKSHYWSGGFAADHPSLGELPSSSARRVCRAVGANGDARHVLQMGFWITPEAHALHHYCWTNYPFLYIDWRALVFLALGWKLRWSLGGGTAKAVLRQQAPLRAAELRLLLARSMSDPASVTYTFADDLHSAIAAHLSSIRVMVAGHSGSDSHAGRGRGSGRVRGGQCSAASDCRLDQPQQGQPMTKRHRLHCPLHSRCLDEGFSWSAGSKRVAWWPFSRLCSTIVRPPLCLMGEQLNAADILELDWRNRAIAPDGTMERGEQFRALSTHSSANCMAITRRLRVVNAVWARHAGTSRVNHPHSPFLVEWLEHECENGSSLYPKAVDDVERQAETALTYEECPVYVRGVYVRGVLTDMVYFFPAGSGSGSRVVADDGLQTGWPMRVWMTKAQLLHIGGEPGERALLQFQRRINSIVRIGAGR